jgi:exonuclease SbcD
MPVRFLHTADWHLGRSIDNRSRGPEFEAVLDELVGLAVEERVEAVLVAGDIFESANPAPEAEALFLETVLRLGDAGIAFVAIAGNHDSASRLEAWRPVLRRFDATIVPRVVPPDQGSVVNIPSRDGSTILRVACVPFVPERRFGEAAALFDAPETWHTAYADGVALLLDRMADAFEPDSVNVLMGHLFADGALLGGGERTATIGLEYAVSPARLPGRAQYVALGHIHRPQDVAAPAPTRYAGSLLQLDFGERGQQKSVTIVEGAPGRPVSAREVALHSGRPLLDVQGTLEQVVAAAAEAGDAYLRVLLEVEGPRPGLADEVRQLVPNAIQVRLVYERNDTEMARAGLGAMAPHDQFVAWHEHSRGTAPSKELLAAFDEVLTLVEEPY